MVIDCDSDNHCDICGILIPVGTVYYAEIDDVMITCTKHSYIIDLEEEKND
jgi:hypothetical protein